MESRLQAAGSTAGRLKPGLQLCNAIPPNRRSVVPQPQSQVRQLGANFVERRHTEVFALEQFVGIPHDKSNILAEYRLPVLIGAFLNADWQHVGRRPLDDINSAYTPHYNLFDVGVRYTRTVVGKLTTWRVTVNNVTDVHYWSTLGPGSITGQSTGSYLGHLGEPRLITASMRIDF